MTFKHKLSARLARLWITVSVVGIFLVLSCQLPERRGVSGPDATVDYLLLTPASVTLAISSMTDFEVVGMTAAGDTAPSQVSWSVTGGTLTDTTEDGPRHRGRYRAGAQPGSYKVIAKTKDGERADTAIVVVTTVAVASVVVAPPTLALDVGNIAQLVATPQDGNGQPLSGRAITWSSGNSGIASVNATGKVTGAGPGTTTVTATSEGQSGSASVTVTQVPVASVVVTPTSASVTVNQTVQLTATPKDAAGYELTGRAVTWASSNTSVATVSTSGLVTGKAVGTATITATSEGQSGTSAITVTSAPVPVASVDVTPTSASVQVNQTVQLTATPKDASGNPLTGRVVTWASSNTSVATVNSSGLVTAKLVGTATVTATSEGQNGTSAITVTASTAPVASVTVSPASTDVYVGGVAQLTATPKDASGNPLTGRVVTWASSNNGVAAVGLTGLVTGVAAGSATITATSEGKSGTSAITVNPLPTGQCGTWPAGIVQWVAPLPLSSGQAFYASPSGSDANPGTLAAPWRSLSKASSLQPGQTLFLRAGTYGARGTTWTFGSRGTASGTITVAGYPGDVRPVLLGAVRMSGEFIRLSGVLFDGPTGNVGGPGPNGEAILIIMNGSHLELSNSEVRYDYWHAGIGADGGFDYRVIGNYIHDNGGYNGDYNDSQNNTSHGMYASPSAYGLVANNIIEHNDAKGWMARHDANHILVVNNTIVGNGRFGVDLAEQSNNIIAANNIVQNNGIMGKGGGGIQMTGAGPYWQINNVYYNNNGSDINGGTVTNRLIANPLLVRPSDGLLTRQVVGDPGTDYHLLAASPAIGHADPNYAIPFDIVGKCRGSVPDAGAYQH